jgi:hypothetical protein
MDSLITALQHPFTLGLLLGLLIAGFVWKAGFSASRHATREFKRVSTEMKDLQGHLNTQLKINASGNEALKTELETLKLQNETLRVNLAILQQAPGFAPAWEKAIRDAEAKMSAADTGLFKLVRRVIPGLGHSPSSPPAVIVNEDPASNV